MKLNALPILKVILKPALVAIFGVFALLVPLSVSAREVIPQDIIWKNQKVSVFSDRLVVRFRKQSTRAEQDRLLADLDLRRSVYLPLIDAEVLEVPASAKIGRVLERLLKSPVVEQAEPDFTKRPMVYPFPNDVLYQTVLAGKSREDWVVQIQAGSVPGFRVQLS